MSKLDPSLGKPVVIRDISWADMCHRAWGAEFFAPDHKVYQFGGFVFKDSTDKGKTGIYGIRPDLMNAEIQLFDQGYGDMFTPLTDRETGLSIQYTDNV
jgi:hypothetical protein